MTNEEKRGKALWFVRQAMTLAAECMDDAGVTNIHLTHAETCLMYSSAQADAPPDARPKCCEDGCAESTLDGGRRCHAHYVDAVL